jgi:hypothetical protein
MEIEPYLQCLTNKYYQTQFTTIHSVCGLNDNTKIMSQHYTGAKPNPITFTEVFTNLNVLVAQNIIHQNLCLQKIGTIDVTSYSSQTPTQEPLQIFQKNSTISYSVMHGKLQQWYYGSRYTVYQLETDPLTFKKLVQAIHSVQQTIVSLCQKEWKNAGDYTKLTQVLTEALSHEEGEQHNHKNLEMPEMWIITQYVYINEL